MEFIAEFILEFLLDVCMEAGRSKKVPGYVRYPLIVILLLFFIAVIGFVFFEGVLFFKENVLAGTFLILVGLFLSIMSIVKFRKVYLTKKIK